MLKNIQEITDRVKQGDQEAFRILVDAYQQYAFNLAFKILRNEDEARDAVQESFIKIWKKICDFRSKQKFTTWMYRIVTNSALDRLRALKRRGHISLDQVAETLVNLTILEPDRQLDNKEIALAIHTLAGDLPDRQQLVFILRDIEGHPSKEVEQILNLTANMVKSNLFHARKAIREKLSNLLATERRAL